MVGKRGFTASEEERDPFRAKNTKPPERVKASIAGFATGEGQVG